MVSWAKNDVHGQQFHYAQFEYISFLGGKKLQTVALKLFLLPGDREAIEDPVKLNIHRSL